MKPALVASGGGGGGGAMREGGLELKHGSYGRLPGPFRPNPRNLAHMREDEPMKRDPLKSQAARIAAIRARSTYEQEKRHVLIELTEARRRGEDPQAFLARLELDAMTAELLGHRR